MVKMIKVTSNTYTSINVDINSNMSYHFMPKNEIKLITQIGTEMNGAWSINDSIISIKIEDETKQFNIVELSDNNLTIASADFMLFLEN